MVEYITRSQTGCVVGATELVDNFDDKTPGSNLAPSERIAELWVVGNGMLNTEDEEIYIGIKLTGEGIVDSPIRIISHASVIGASGTGEDADVQMTPVKIPVNIACLPGRSIRAWGIIAGTASVTANIALTMVFA